MTPVVLIVGGQTFTVPALIDGDRVTISRDDAPDIAKLDRAAWEASAESGEQHALPTIDGRVVETVHFWHAVRIVVFDLAPAVG